MSQSGFFFSSTLLYSTYCIRMKHHTTERPQQQKPFFPYNIKTREWNRTKIRKKEKKIFIYYPFLFQAKIHYLDIISGLPSYGAKCFSTNQRDGVERVLLISPRFGLSQIAGVRNSVVSKNEESFFFRL